MVNFPCIHLVAHFEVQNRLKIGSFEGEGHCSRLRVPLPKNVKGNRFGFVFNQESDPQNDYVPFVFPFKPLQKDILKHVGLSSF